MESKTPINNEFYDDLGERWYTASDDPIAFLRAESRVKNPWVLGEIRELAGETSCRVLDIGCGGGFLTNYLARHGHDVTGVDRSGRSLEIARSRDETGKVSYREADAYSLPFSDSKFDVVCAMDFLEHVEEPELAVREAARVLKPGGTFFFHTFNRNWLSGLLAIHAIEWLVRNTPENFHVYRLFIKPKEMDRYCRQAGLVPEKWTGIRPELLRWDVLSHILSGRVPESFSFKLTPSLRVGYLGVAIKTETRSRTDNDY